MSGESTDAGQLVGRKIERAAISAALTMAANGVAGTLMISGAVGVGKTRLAQEAVTMARRAGFACAWGAGFVDGGLPPMWPWQSILAQLDHDDVGLDPEQNQFGCDDGEGGPRFGHFRNVVDRLAKSSARVPTLIVVDDAHALDMGALLLIRFVIRSLRASRLVVLLTVCDDDTIDDSIRGVIDDIGSDGRILRPLPITDDHVDQLLTADGATSMQAVCDQRIHRLRAPEREVIAAIALLGRCSSRDWIAEITGVDIDTVNAAIVTATAAGLLTEDSGELKVRHHFATRTVLASYSSAELAAKHNRIADGLGGAHRAQSVERVAAAARHRIAGAALIGSRVEIDRAGLAARTASAQLLRRMAFETASDITTLAIGLYDGAELAVPVGLLLDTARSELAAGRLAQARRWFRRAAEHATAPPDLAVAALGLGGMWVNEHRNRSDHAAFMSLLHRAAAGLGPDDHILAVRLAVRIAAEDVYSGTGSHERVTAAVDAARATGDPSVIAEALSLLLHTMLGPPHAGARRPIADEMTRAAAMSGDGLLVLLAAMWRAIDLILGGDPRAERALNELREQADALQVAAVLFVVKALDVMRLIRQGRLTDALQASEDCYDLGHRLGDADAVAYLGGQVLTIRWLQQRSDEMLGLARQVADSPTLIDGDTAFPAAVALLTAMTGKTAEASATMYQVLRGSKLSIEFSSNWLITMFLAAETAALLGDATAAGIIYEALEPYADLPVMASLGIVCVGSANRTLAVAARTMNRLDLAVDHFQRGLAENHRLGNRVMAAITQGELGATLLQRCQAGDEGRGRELVEAAIVDLRQLGLVERAALFELGLTDAAEASPALIGRVVQRGSVWELCVGDQTIQLTDTVGAQRLIHLLEHPFVDVPASDLVGGVAPAATQEMVDSKALRAYHDRVVELRHEIDGAEADHDLARVERLRDELDAILSHLSSSEALFGRSRRFVNAHERARIAVRKSLTRVIDEVSAQAPQFAVALADSIRTGSMCRFHPQTPFPATWQRVTSVAVDGA